MAVATSNIQWPDDAITEALEAATAALPKETGGILVGWHQGQVIHVARFVEVPDPHARRFGYRRRVNAANAALGKAIEEAGPGTALGYVGEWHAHPAPQTASSLDRRSLRSIATESREPVGLVILARTGDTWEPHTYIARRRRSRGAFLRGALRD